MRKLYWLTVSVAILSMFSLLLSSCKDDDPPAKPLLSFAVSTLTINEADDIVEIEVKLDKPASEDITIEYSISGSANEKVAAGTSLPADYEIIADDYLEVEIKKGETTGIIQIDPYSDSDYEDDETIEISIESVDSENIEITRDDEINITLEQENGLIILLQWGIGDGENYTDVDMDLFLWAESTTTSELVAVNYYGLSGTSRTSLRGSYASPEFLFLPAAFDDGNYGISCNYYEGTVEPMNFEVSFIEIVNSDDVSTVTRKGTYNKININPWQDETLGTDLQLVLTFQETAGDFTNFSEALTIPASGSRSGTSCKVPSDMTRQK